LINESVELQFNIRGLGVEIKKKELKKIIAEEGIDMVYMQKTKMESV